MGMKCPYSLPRTSKWCDNSKQVVPFRMASTFMRLGNFCQGSQSMGGSGIRAWKRSQKVGDTERPRNPQVL